MHLSHACRRFPLAAALLLSIAATRSFALPSTASPDAAERSSATVDPATKRVTGGIGAAPRRAARRRARLLACGASNIIVGPCTSSATVNSYSSTTATFTFSNNTTRNVTASFGCSVVAPVTSCTVSPASATIFFSDVQDVTVTYQTGAGPATGSVTVFGAGVSAVRSVVVRAPPIYATPKTTFVRNRSAYSAAADTFTVQNNSASAVSIALTASCASIGTCAVVGANPRTVSGGGATAQVIVTSTNGEVSATPGTIALKALASALPAPGNQDSGYVRVWVPYAPTIVATPHNGDHRDPGFCVAACFDVTTSYVTPSYVSLDAERSLMLWYSSAQASPVATVQLDLADGSMPSPNTTSLQLRRADGTAVDFTNSTQEIFYAYPTSGAPFIRMAGQFDVTARSTGAYSYTAEVASYWTSPAVRRSTNSVLSVLVLNESASPYGAGWSIAGVQRLYVDSAPSVMVATDGAGEITKFKSANGGATYASSAGDFSKLTRRVASPDSALYDRRYPDGMTYSFLPDGRLRYTKDRFGNTTHFGYAGTTLLRTVTDPAGKSITLGYDLRGKLSTITDPGGRVTRFTVDSVTNNLTTIVDATGAVTFQATYDGRHRLSSRADRAGSTWLYRYDFAGKLASDSTPSVEVGGTPHRLGTRYRSLETAALADTAVYASPGVRVGSVEAPAPAVTPSVIRALVFTSGDSVRYAADRFGAPTLIEYATTRNTTTIVRNQHSQITSTQTVAAGRTIGSTTSVWSGSRLMSESDHIAGTSATYAYDTTFSLLTEVGGTAGEQHFYLDSATKSRVESARMGPCCTVPATRFSYDSRGRVKRTFDPRSDSTVLVYADTGYQNTLSVRVGARVTQFIYDSYGRVRRTINPRGEAIVTQYDSLNRVRSEVAPYSATTSLVYDSLAVRTVTDPLGQTYTFDRNALGWLTKRTGANTLDSLANRQDEYHYSALGRDSLWTNRRKQDTRTTYDAQGRLKARTLSDYSVTSFSYDTLGRWAADSSGASIDTVRTDSTGRVTTEVTVRNGWKYFVTATTDQAGLLRSIVMTGGEQTNAAWYTTTFGYNALQRLDTIKVNSGGLTRITYDPDGQVTRISLPSADTINYSYSSQHRPSEMHFRRGALEQALGGYFGQDSLDRLASWSTASGDSSFRFRYDSLGRLAWAGSYYMPGMICEPDPHGVDGMNCTTPQTPWPGPSQSFAYDLGGNPAATGVAVDPGNRLTAFGGFTMSYDFDGNMKAKSGTGLAQALTWNSVNQLTSVTTNGAIVRFAYDGQGRRIRKSTASKTTEYIYFGNQVIAELDSATGIVQSFYSYYPGVDAPHSVTRGVNTYFYVNDAAGVGSVMGLIDGSGNLVNRYRYEAFGASRGKTEAVPNPLQFAGREYDGETGLYFNRARYYDPQLHRFISEDPVGLAGGLNQYAYAANDPVNGRDPSGLYPCMIDQYWEIRINGMVDHIANHPILGECSKDGPARNRPRDGDDTRAQQEADEKPPYQKLPCTADILQFLHTPGIAAARRLVFEKGQSEKHFRTGKPLEYGVWANVATVVEGTLTTDGSAVTVNPKPLDPPKGATSFVHNHSIYFEQWPSWGKALFGLGEGDWESANRQGTLDVVQATNMAFLVIPGRGVAGCQLRPDQ